MVTRIMKIAFILQHFTMIYLFFFRILEHSYAVARGFEERGKRPNYRPILEHDGLFWHRAQNQVNYALTFTCSSYKIAL